MSLAITQMLVPQLKHHIKCTYEMKPQFIVIHNTYNDASAMNEISYMIRNNNYTSYHFAVDDNQAVQGLPLNRNGWHCGDGLNGIGNRNGIGIEICYSKSGGERYTKAEENAVILTAMLMKQFGWNSRDKIKKHQDFMEKDCPHRILNEARWEQFKDRVMAVLNGESKPETITNNTNTVYLKDTALHYATGPLIPKWAKGKNYTILKQEGNRVLLKELYSWVNRNDLIFNQEAPKTEEYKRISEVGTFTLTVDKLNVRNEPNTKNNTPVAQYEKGDSINYDSYCVANGYVWISYVSNSGVRRYVACRPLNANGKWGQAYGVFR